MGKRSHHVIQCKQKRGGMPGGKPLPHARSLRGTHKQFNAIWEASQDGLIACDRYQKITRISAAARKLFEVDSETQCQGRDIQQFLAPYICTDEQPPFVSQERWLMSLALAKETGACLPLQALLLYLPSGHKVPVTVQSFPVDERGRPSEETILVFHAWPEISHLQRVQEAMVDLITAIAQIPEQMDHVLPEETFLLSPPVLFVAQQLMDVIRSVLECHDAEVLAFGRCTGRLYFMAASGLNAEQEQYWRDVGGLFHPSEVLDDAAYARLLANQEVVRTIDQLHPIRRLGKQLPFPAALRLGPSGTVRILTFLFLPLFLEQQWVGVLLVIKASSERKAYTPEEIALAKAVTTQTMLVLEGIHYLYAQEEQRQKALVQREVSRLADDFLTLATHELRTPLTATMGQLQLAQRRLQTLKNRLTPLGNQIRESLVSVQQPLVSASQSAQLQQRMINDLIDDARIQTHMLTLSLHQEDLLALLREVVATQQHIVSEHPIVLDAPAPEQVMPIFADAGRIKQVLTIYLRNALTASPPGRPVVVRVRMAKALARVSVHNEGAGMAREDLDHLWERFYRAKGSSVQHELDLSFGLALYLCRVFIEQHQGNVGVQSAPGRGATFWFTLPITSSVEK